MAQAAFLPGQWENAGLYKAYTFRYSQTPPPRQGPDYLYSDKNPDHPPAYHKKT